MKFHEHKTLYSARHIESMKEWWKLSPNDFYYNLILVANERSVDVGDSYHSVRANVENIWYANVRPYFKVWPSIADSLMRVRLDRSFKEFQLPGISILIRFAEEKEPLVGDNRLCSVLVAHQPSTSEGMVLGIFATYRELDGNKRDKYICTRTDTDICTVEDQINNYSRYEDSASDGPSRLDSQALIRIIISVLLMSEDSEFIKPDVLTADRAEYDRTGDPKLVEKARKRGVVGWRMGEAYESIPHIRRPHFGLRWCERGRTVPRIVPIKGSVVHRDKLTQVPTGYITPQDVEVEV